MRRRLYLRADVPLRGLPLRECAEVGSMLATYVIETVGTQEYDLTIDSFVERFREAYGDQSADLLAAALADQG